MGVLDTATSALGATIGVGLTPRPQQQSYQPIDYSGVFENIQQQQQKQADRDYSLKKKELDQQASIAKAQAKTAQERNAIDKWYNEQQVALAGQRLAQEQQQFQARLDFDKQTEAHNFGLAQAKQGYDLLNMQANLRGPQNYYQAAELARGVAAQPGTATFLSALKNNTNLAPYGAQAGVPDKVSVDSLAGKLGYTGAPLVPTTGAASGGGLGTSVNADDTNLNAIRGIGLAGAQKLGAGSLEGLTDTERKLLMSGLDASGFDTPTFLDQYRRSRIGQSYGNVNAA